MEMCVGSENDESLISLLRDPQKGISIQNRKWLFKTYPLCFIGRELVDWFLRNNLCQTRTHAVTVGQQLMNNKIIHHVTRDHPFRDEDLYYRFLEDELALRGIENEQHSWTSYLPFSNEEENLQPNLPEYEATKKALKKLELFPLDEHNSKLLDSVHPARFVNIEPAPRYNIVVLGAGAAGLVTAAGSAGVGAKVALVEEHFLGGDCLNYGCVPSKALLRAAHSVAELKKMAEWGVTVPRIDINFSVIMERMRRIRASMSPNDSVARFQKELGIDVFIGHASFKGPDSVEVDGKILKFSKCCIATGATAAVPTIPGLNEVPFLTNASLFNLTELPRRFGIIGAGAIGCEMAQAFARFGSEVWLLARTENVLEKEELEAVEIVQESLKNDGVHILCGITFESVEKNEEKEIIIHIKRNEILETVVVDQLLVCTGRKPNVQDLNLEAAGVEYDERMGIRVTRYLQTTNSNIYAAGDVCTKYKFTHIADFMARTVIRNALFFGSAKVTDFIIPWCTYTDPEIAHVGVYPWDLRVRGIKFNTFIKHFKEVDRAILDGNTQGFVKVLVGEGTDKILGATIVGKHAGDMISELTTAMFADVGLSRIASIIHPYPTQSEAIRQVGDQYNKTRLTPTIKIIFRRIMESRR